ncbi:DUF4245 domain-containing protein [Nocardia sp. NPDC003482]
MSSPKPRILHDYRDLFWSLIPLVLICVVLAGVASQCSFTTHGPTQGRIPEFDLRSALRDDARTLPFPIRQPSLPDTWKPNSGTRDTVTGTGGGAVSTVGFITPQGSYMQLTQSNASVDALANHIESTRTPSGTQRIDDHVWTVFHVQGSEPAWITDLGPVRLLVKGAGDQSAYTTLATAAAAAPPVQP